MGRTKQPAEIIELYGKSHISKAELEKRNAGELRLEQKGLKPDKLVSADKRALAEFRRLKKLYGEIAFIAALDNHLINQYCLAVSELDDLVQLLSEVRGQLADLPGMGEEGKRKQLSGLFLELDQEVRLKRAAVAKLGDRLYLNPVARVKHVPPKSKQGEEPEDPMAALLQGRRA